MDDTFDDYAPKLSKGSLDQLGKQVKKKNKGGMDDTFDRLRELDVDSFATGSDASNMDMIDQMLNRAGRKAKPYIADTLSEINDEKEKNAIFNHSLKDGLFNDLRHSPLRDRMPHDLQFYNPALEKRIFAKEHAKQPGAGPSRGRSQVRSNA